MKYLILSAALGLAACSGGHSHDGIEISNVRINPPLPGQTTAVGFLELYNHGPADQIVGVTSPISDRVELHTHEMENGIMKMRRVPAIDIPADGTVTLQPGGLHIMLFGSDVDGVSETTVTLDYRDGEDVTLNVPIVPRGTMPEADGGHAGH